MLVSAGADANLTRATARSKRNKKGPEARRFGAFLVVRAAAKRARVRLF